MDISVIKKLVYFTLFVCAYANAIDDESLETPTAETIVNKAAKKFMVQHEIPGMAIALYVDDKPYLFHFGFSDKEKKRLVNEKTIFEIGSISKVFTCLLFAQEVIDKKMSFSDSIVDYVQPFTSNKKLKKMTLGKLATHTSSLPYDAPPSVQTREDLVRHVAVWSPKDQHFHWNYSNHGIELLAIALEKKSKKSIHELFIDKILKPLEMKPIGVKVPLEYKSLCASCYAKDGTKSTPWSDQPYLLGSGLLHASNLDMLNFLKASLGCPGTPELIQKAMQMTQTPFVIAHGIKQGLGWHIDVLDRPKTTKAKHALGTGAAWVKEHERVFNGDHLFDKTGTTQGFHSYIAAIPNQKMGIVVMINKRMNMGYKKIKRLGREILKSISYN
jgi:beta-lactamase class C